jgi:hypothetical protein
MRRDYDDRVNDATPGSESGDPDPGPGSPPTAALPGERRLAHPPSDRYRAAEAGAAEAAEAAPDPAASIPRGLTIAIVAGLFGAGAIVFVGGVVTLTTGLLAIAGLTGLAIAIGLVFGAGDRLDRRRRVTLAVGLALASVALGQLGLWQYGRSEGGVLPLIEYLAEVFGLLVPAEFLAAGIVAGVAAR